MMLGLIIFAHVASALPLSSANGNAVATLWTFPNETWIENLADRANGVVLCTSLNRAGVYQVDPLSHIADMVHQFQSTEGVLGIAEISNDAFVTVTANVSLGTSTTWLGSAKIWRLDLAAWELGKADAASLVGDLLEIILLDGVATLPYDPNFILVADAAQGIMWRVNTATGEYSKAIDDPLFKPTNSVPLGVNGIHILRDQLYFTNLATNSVGKLRITTDGHAAGPVEILTDEALAVDDFALAEDGTAYAAGSNILWEVQADGSGRWSVG